jgi:hypothetical protein
MQLQIAEHDKKGPRVARAGWDQQGAAGGEPVGQPPEDGGGDRQRFGAWADQQAHGQAGQARAGQRGAVPAAPAVALQQLDGAPLKCRGQWIARTMSATVSGMGGRPWDAVFSLLICRA